MVQNISCEQTFPGNAVPACVAKGDYVDIKSRSGGTIIAASGTVVGDTTVRARCTSTGLDIRIAKINSTETDSRNFNANNDAWFRREPVSKLPLGWTHPQSSLFASTLTAPCARKFITTPSSGCGNNEYGVNRRRYLLTWKVRSPFSRKSTICRAAAMPALMFASSVCAPIFLAVKRTRSANCALRSAWQSGATSET